MLVAVALAAALAAGGWAGVTPAAPPGEAACAAHEDPLRCAADAACVWYPNTRPCKLGEPCPAGWCHLRPPAGMDPAETTSLTTGCACPGGGPCDCERP